MTNLHCPHHSATDRLARCQRSQQRPVRDWDLPKQLVPDVKGDRQQVKDQMKRFRDWGLARLKQKGIDSAEKVRALTLEDCKAVAALLAAKATPQEANEYRKWALSVAEEVPESWTNKIATS